MGNVEGITAKDELEKAVSKKDVQAKGLPSKHMVFYLMLGYPNWDMFYAVLDELEVRGIGYVEIGIPALDPYADGAVIRHAHEQVRGCLTREDIVDALGKIRHRYSFRVVLMTYGESLDCYELSRLERWRYDAVLCLDCELRVADYSGIVRVFSGETDEAEMHHMLGQCSEFAYVVTGSGLTGQTGPLPTEFITTIARIRGYSEIPVFVGFGLSSKEDIQTVVHSGADGAIIGSELIRRIDAGGVVAVREYLAALGM
ncbi:tryptophan synthase subunit alpha [Collinsella sp. zg1085]|uniref:tryptophan synthase subunit alpha n=1 Tax=Collinsella sp. zg1085 TaxID=2844380 RepID=UPI001C0B6DC6|nr:tryptophan synthase subunit alpha [Collinsella sp. zg1085]QWT17538.1 tryptophan synthase subunit alpha [Collinsella sp. zg1085]